MQSNLRVLQSIIQKIKSPLRQIRNRAITTLYTKVSAKIITDTDLINTHQLPGVLFHWVNENTPMNKDGLFKTLTILHRYTLSDKGLRLLCEYEAVQFLQQLRKFLMGNETNCEEYVDLIKRIIKTVLPLMSSVQRKGTNGQQQLQQQYEGQQQLSQQLQYGDSTNNKSALTIKSKQTKSKAKPKQQKNPNNNSNSKQRHNNSNNKQRQIIQFYYLPQNETMLPKQIDQQLYSLLIQLKHGKKQAVLQTLIKIQDIVIHWGWMYFGYKQQLVKQLVTFIEGIVYSQIACRVLSIMLRQALQMQEDIGVINNINSNINDANNNNKNDNDNRDWLRTVRIGDNINKKQIVRKQQNKLFKKIQFEIKFDIYTNNPFTFIILDAIISNNNPNSNKYIRPLPQSAIEYLLIAITKFPFSSSYLLTFLQRIIRNQQWVKQHLHNKNKFYQQQLLQMINYCCGIQSNIYNKVIPLLQKLFPNKTLEQISLQIPTIAVQLRQQQIQKSFNVLKSYSIQQNNNKNNNNNNNNKQFEFNLELHKLQSHIQSLQQGIQGLAKKPQVISLYIDCLLTLAISVAKQDPLMCYYPKIKQLIIRISQHEYMQCRVMLYQLILMCFNSSQKMNYLSQSYNKCQLIRLVFTDGEFFSELFKRACQCIQTVSLWLQIVKVVQLTMKQENRKYLIKYVGVFYVISLWSINKLINDGNKGQINNKSTISSSSKLILSKINKKYQIINILISLFCSIKQQRTKTYMNILGLQEQQDLLKYCKEYVQKNSQTKTNNKKYLKYSLSTIRNYMAIILNPKLQFQIKSSAIEQMIECIKRIDLSIVQLDEEFMKQLFSIHNAIQDYIKGFVNNGNNNDNKSSISITDRHCFIKMVRIYSILYKRFKLQMIDDGHNQTSIKLSSFGELSPQMYLNVLINLCMYSGGNDNQYNDYEFKQAIAEYLLVLYHVVITRYVSGLLLVGEQQKGKNINKDKDKNKDKDNNKGIIIHWIVDMFPHQRLIQQNVQQQQSSTLIKKKNTILSSSSNNKGSSQNNNLQLQKLVNDFLKVYSLSNKNIKSLKQLVMIYIQHCQQQVSQPTNNNTIESLKVKSNTICPILQRQISTVIQNINSSQSQLSFLLFVVQSITLMKGTNNHNTNILQTLQQIIPHLMNQLQKPNISQHINIMLIKLCNAITWKRTKTVDMLVQQFTINQLYYLKLFYKLPTLRSQQLSKIIKTTLSSPQHINNPKYNSSICMLWQIMLKHPANIKKLLLSSTEYIILLVLNSLVKCIQNQYGDYKLSNYSIILLHQVLNQAYFEVKKIGGQKVNQNSLDYVDDNDNKNGKKIIETIKLINSLSIGPSLMKFILQQFQHSNRIENKSLSLQSLCFLLQAIKSSLSIKNFILINQLHQQSSAVTNINHEIKIVKLFVISLNEYIRANPQLMRYSSAAMFYSSVMNFMNSLLKNPAFSQSAAQVVDMLDFGVTLFYEKSKILTKSTSQQPKFIKTRQSQSYLLFCSIIEYIYLRLQQNPKQLAHYLLSSSSFLQASFLVMIYLKNNPSFIQSNQRIKTYVKQLLQKLGKVLYSMSLHQQDYFIFKMNHVCQQFEVTNLLETFAYLNQYGGQHFLVFFMRLVLIWQGKSQGQKISQQFQTLNPTEIFQDQQQDDSSIQERQLFSKDQKPKHPYQNNWIYKLVDMSVQRNHIKYCKSLIALSLPAKMFLIEKPGFGQYLKKITSLIDSKIIYESTTNKKKIPKKANVGGNSSIILSNSRKSVVSQNLSSFTPQDQIKLSSSAQDDKITQIEDFMKFLTALFAVHETLKQSQKQQFYISNFTSHLNRYKDILRKLFYSVDKLYTLSELVNSNGNRNKEFMKNFFKLINALSESVIFSQSLSNHLTEVTSPMLEQSVSTMLKGLSQQTNQQDSQRLKKSLKLLSTLSNHQSVRSYIYKNKLIQELNSRIIRYEQKKVDKSDFINLNSLYDIVGFYSSLSKYKDSHNKILNDKKVLQVLINQVYMQKSDLISQKILQLLSNLSAYKLNKAVFMQNRQIHKTILGQLQSTQIKYKCHLLTLLYNLIYRHAAAVKLYKRKDIIEMIEAIPWEKFDNWENVKHIQVALMEVLKSQSQVPDKN